MTYHPSFGLIDVYAATIPTLPFKPAVHVNYAETVLRMHDGLPKFKDFPAPMGGSGEMLGELDSSSISQDTKSPTDRSDWSNSSC